jgi:hypothetical protein
LRNQGNKASPALALLSFLPWYTLSARWARIIPVVGQDGVDDSNSRGRTMYSIDKWYNMGIGSRQGVFGQDGINLLDDILSTLSMEGFLDQSTPVGDGYPAGDQVIQLDKVPIGEDQE